MNKHLDDERFAYMEKNGFTKEMVILYEEIALDKENPNHNVERLAKRESLFLILVKIQKSRRIKKMADTLCLILIAIWAVSLAISNKKLALIPNIEAMLGFDPFLRLVVVSMIALPIGIGTMLLAFRLISLRKTGLKLIDDIKRY